MRRTSAPPSGELSRPTLAEVMSWYRGGAERARKVDPQLKAVEETSGHHDVLGGRLDVQDACTRGHPLGVAATDQPAPAVGVLVLK